MAHEVERSHAGNRRAACAAALSRGRPEGAARRYSVREPMRPYEGQAPTRWAEDATCAPCAVAAGTCRASPGARFRAGPGCPRAECFWSTGNWPWTLVHAAAAQVLEMAHVATAPGHTHGQVFAFFSERQPRAELRGRQVPRWVGGFDVGRGRPLHGGFKGIRAWTDPGSQAQWRGVRVQSRRVPVMQLTLWPPTQTWPSASRSRCTRPARPRASPWAAR